MTIEIENTELVIKIPYEQIQTFLTKNKKKLPGPRSIVIQEEAYLLADMLNNLIGQHRKVYGFNRTGWAKQIMLLCFKDKLNWQEIKSGIIYSQLEENRMDKFFPVIYSAATLRSKWPKLINYRKNHGGESESFADKAGKYSEIGLF